MLVDSGPDKCLKILSGHTKGISSSDGKVEPTITSTVSYRLTTMPSWSTMGTALIPRLLNICTTEDTAVLIVAVAIG